MSNFRLALQRDTERRTLPQADLAKTAGLSRSYVNRLLSGGHADLSDDSFVAILKVFGADKRAQAELVAARCMDARVGPGAELVEISIKDGTKPRETNVELPDVHLSKETERAFAWLRSQCPVNMDLEKHLISYARLTGMK
jgi:transcriptional regulator with XRE-family HTH domain